MVGPIMADKMLDLQCRSMLKDLAAAVHCRQINLHISKYSFAQSISNLGIYEMQ